jgi:hypothetical protein
LLATTPAYAVALGLAIDFALNVGVFAVVGAIIVALRGGKSEQRSPSEKEIDAELARIRAEAARRDSGG